MNSLSTEKKKGVDPFATGNFSQKLMEGVTLGLRSLLLTEDPDDAINLALSQIGSSIQVDRVYVFRNHPGENDAPCISQQYEWCNEGVPSQADNPELQGLPYFPYFEHWYNTLSKGLNYGGIVSQLATQEERDLLEPQGILSILVVPIFHNSYFWGFVGYDDCQFERAWNEGDRNIIATLSAGIGSVIERAQAKRKIEDQKNFYENILNSIPSSLMVFSPEHKYKFVNPAAISDKEVREWLIGRDDFDYCAYRNKDISIAEGRRAIFEEVLHSGKTKIWEEYFQEADGSESWGLRYMSPIMNAQGELEMAIGYGLDITDRKQAENRLNAINNLAVALLGKYELEDIAREVTSKTMQQLGLEECIIFLLDKEQNELREIATSGVDRPEGSVTGIQLGKGIVGAVAASGKPEMIADTTADRRYIVWSKQRKSELAVPIIADGEVIGVIDSEHSERNFYTQDHLQVVTTIANMIGAQLKSAIAQREKAIAEEALKKSEAQLKEKTQKLEAQNAELEQFAYIASHDLQEPIWTVIGFVQMIQEEYKDQLGADAEQYLDFILKSSGRMRELVMGLLDYSRIGKEKVLAKVDINNTVKEVLADMTVSIKESNAVIEVNNLPVMTGYPLEMRQLFQNLISNAIKFRKKDTQPVITVSAEKHINEWCFSVKDNGIGIDEKYSDKIFVIFKQLHNRNEYEGTGIGLSHCKKIVELHGGRIWQESVPEEGTTFFFTIPFFNHE